MGSRWRLQRCAVIMRKTPHYTRTPNWPEKLAALIQAVASSPFKWGTHDCCQFARRSVRELTGRDPARGLGLRNYKTARGALNNLRRLGGLEALAEKAGLPSIPVLRAQRGDVALARVGPRNDNALGIVVGAKAAFVGAHGLVFVPLGECLRAWRV